jgi:Cytochrome oxidase complex assembly protein 1
MTTTSQPAPRRSNGCLWGCFVVLAIVFLPLLIAGGYGAWFVYQGFRNDPVLRTVTVLLRQDGLAHRVLGNDIHVTGVQGNAFSFVPGLVSHTDYEVTLSGDKASGILDVEADTSHGRVDIKSMILTVPHGGRYDLLRNVVLQQPHGETDSI